MLSAARGGAGMCGRGARRSRSPRQACAFVVVRSGQSRHRSLARSCSRTFGRTLADTSAPDGSSSSPNCQDGDWKNSATQAARPAKLSSERARVNRSALEWVDDSHTTLHEIGTVARDHRQSVHQGGRGNQAVLDRHRLPAPTKARQQRRPLEACTGRPSVSSGDAERRRRTILRAELAVFHSARAGCRSGARRR